MTAIGKTFTHHDEQFIVVLKGHDHYICTSLRDKRAWRFSYIEIAEILNAERQPV